MEFGWKQYWFQYAETVTLFAGYVLPENQEYNVGIYFPGESSFKVYISKARLYMSLENFFTFDKLNGLPIDPEAISGYSMFRSDSNYNLGRTGMGTPVFKTLSCGVQLTF